MVVILAWTKPLYIFHRRKHRPSALLHLTGVSTYTHCVSHIIYSLNHCEMKQIATASIIAGMPFSPEVGAGGFFRVNVGKGREDKKQLEEDWRLVTTLHYYI
jgi:hypothetical protein